MWFRATRKSDPKAHASRQLRIGRRPLRLKIGSLETLPVGGFIYAEMRWKSR